MSTKSSQTYGDLLLDLKKPENGSISPTNKNYSSFVKDWIKKNIFHSQPISVLSEVDISAIKKFSDNFVKRSREKWKQNNYKLYYGQSVAIDNWLKKPIEISCNCSECVSKDTVMETDEAEQSKVVEVEDLGTDESADHKSEEPNGQSKSSSISFCTF